jgi:hypothetical protein
MTNKLTNSNEQSPSWEYDSHSASQEILQVKREVHHSAHKSPPLVHILSQMNPVHTHLISLT